MEIIPNKVSKLEQATWVTHTTGTYDIFLWAAVESTEELGKFINCSADDYLKTGLLIE